jgi:4-amino-4-deoxy-L-arabinose transferase-like glycosyltransferase
MASRTPPRLVVTLLGLILLVAFAVRFWGISFGLPHTEARPDERAIIDVTRSFLSGNFTPYFFDYPWLYMWVLTALYLLYSLWGIITGTFHSVAEFVASWPTAWIPFFLINRSLAAVLGAVTVIPVFWIGRRLWDDATGLLAAFFLALTFLHVRDSHFGTTDTMMTLFIVLSIAYLVEAEISGRRLHFALAGLMAGLAAATKYNALVLPISMVMSQALHASASPGGRLKAFVDKRMLGYGAALSVAFAIGVPFVVFDFARFRLSMEQLWDSMMKGVGSIAPDVNGWAHHFGYSLRYGLGWPLLLAGLLGMIVVFARTPKRALVFFSFPLVYFLIAGSIRNLFFRYAIPIVPFLSLSAAVLVIEIARALAGRASAGIARVAFVSVAAVLAAVVVGPSAASIVQFDRLLSRTDNRVVVLRWFEMHVPPGSSVVQSGSIYGYAQFDRKLQYKVWVWDRGRRRFLVEGQTPEGRPDWILVQESPLPSETQAVIKDFLKEGYELATLFKAVDLDRWHLYDMQDAFFVPFAGFDGVNRPGPNFTLYKRAGAPML